MLRRVEDHLGTGHQAVLATLIDLRSAIEANDDDHG
jgi:hypothetical protein